VNPKLTSCSHRATSNTYPMSFKINFNVLEHSPRSPKRSHLSRFPDWNSSVIYHSSHACYMVRPSSQLLTEQYNLWHSWQACVLSTNIC